MSAMGSRAAKEWQPVVYTGSKRGRRKTMEDTHRSLDSLNTHNEFAFYAVYDGHNGDSGAKWIDSRLHEQLDSNLGARGSYCPPAKVISSLIEAFTKVDDDFYRLCEKSGDESGCTAVVALLNKVSQHLVVANAGDARCILAKADGKVEPLTIDHKPNVPEERERIEKAGHMIADGRLDMMLSVSRAFGDFSFKAKDTHLKHQNKALTCYPYVREIQLSIDNEEHPVISNTANVEQFLSPLVSPKVGSLNASAHSPLSLSKSPSIGMGSLTILPSVSEDKRGFGSSPTSPSSPLSPHNASSSSSMSSSSYSSASSSLSSSTASHTSNGDANANDSDPNSSPKKRHERTISRHGIAVNSASAPASPQGSPRHLAAATTSSATSFASPNPTQTFDNGMPIVPNARPSSKKKKKNSGLSYNPNHHYQFLVIACDGLFDVMTNQEVVDWVNSELRLRARAMRDTLRHALQENGIPPDRFFPLTADETRKVDRLELFNGLFNEPTAEDRAKWASDGFGEQISPDPDGHSRRLGSRLFRQELGQIYKQNSNSNLNNNNSPDPSSGLTTPNLFKQPHSFPRGSVSERETPVSSNDSKNGSPTPSTSSSNFSSIATSSSSSSTSPDKDKAGRGTPPTSSSNLMMRQGSANLNSLGLDGAGAFNLGRKSFAEKKASMAKRQSKTWAAEPTGLKPLEQIAEELCMHAIRKGSTDNVTVMIVMLDEPPKTATKKLTDRVVKRARALIEREKQLQAEMLANGASSPMRQQLGTPSKSTASQSAADFKHPSSPLSLPSTAPSSAATSPDSSNKEGSDKNSNSESTAAEAAVEELHLDEESEQEEEKDEEEERERQRLAGTDSSSEPELSAATAAFAARFANTSFEEEPEKPAGSQTERTHKRDPPDYSAETRAVDDNDGSQSARSSRSKGRRQRKARDEGWDFDSPTSEGSSVSTVSSPALNSGASSPCVSPGNNSTNTDTNTALSPSARPKQPIVTSPSNAADTDTPAANTNTNTSAEANHLAAPNTDAQPHSPSVTSAMRPASALSGGSGKKKKKVAVNWNFDDEETQKPTRKASNAEQSDTTTASKNASTDGDSGSEHHEWTSSSGLSLKAVKPKARQSLGDLFGGPAEDSSETTTTTTSTAASAGDHDHSTEPVFHF